MTAGATRRSFLAELEPESWSATLAAGVISGVVTTVFSISMVGLIFRDELIPFIPIGVGWFLMGAVVLGLWVALTSSYAGNIATPQGKTAILLALAAAPVSESVAPEQLLPTVFMLLALTSLLTGASLWLLGFFRLGNLIRFLPHPVIGGFQVGTGWLIFVGAFSVLTGHRLGFENLPALGSGEALAQWFPALAYAVFMLVVLRFKPHFLALTVLLGVAIVACYAAFWIDGAPLTAYRNSGWLLGPFQSSRLLEFPDFEHVAWSALGQQTPIILVVVLLVSSDVLLNSVAIEVSTNARLDLDQELKSTGIGNLGAAGFGGLAGYSAISLVVLNHKVGASSRATAILSALSCAVFLLIGMPLLDYFPVPVLGALLLFIGLSFMKEWVWDGRDRLGSIDYALLIVIWLLIATFGFIEGVSAGLLIAMAIFIVTYSRIDVVRLELSGEHLRSNRERPAHETQILDTHGAAIHAFKLQGFVFFGTAHNLLERVRSHFETRDERRVEYVILDFSTVTGTDSSAVASFRQMGLLAASRGTRLLFSNVSEDVARMLDTHDLRRATFDAVGRDATLDRCVEWCEEQLIAEHAASGTDDRGLGLGAILQGKFSRDEAEVFHQYLLRREFAVGEVLFPEGSPSDSLVFIESGMLVAIASDAFGHESRVRSFGPGAIVGEMGLYTRAPRSARVMAVADSTVHLLTREALERLEQSQPRLATTLHVSIAQTLSHRLGQANNTIKYLQK